ncbi:hypothetical protein CMU38_13010 [Elizabethkingia anophelis]|nr:hypothetical protein [Elizabethkingia anophelis]
MKKITKSELRKISVAAPDVLECYVQYAMMAMVLPVYAYQGGQIHFPYAVQTDRKISSQLEGFYFFILCI